MATDIPWLMMDQMYHTKQSDFAELIGKADTLVIRINGYDMKNLLPPLGLMPLAPVRRIFCTQIAKICPTPEPSDL